MVDLRILIVGGGKIGKYLAKTLKKEGNKISLVEINEEKSRELAKDLDVLIINGDATNIDVLKDADAVNADVFVAVTDNDDTNLVASQVAKKEFDISNTIARVNDESKKDIFEKIGVDTVITMTDAAATSFKNAIHSSPLRTIFSYGEENIELNEFKIEEDSKVKNKALKDIDLPKKSVIVSIIRDEDIVFPQGDVVLKKDDKVLILMYCKNIDKIEKLF